MGEEPFRSVAAKNTHWIIRCGMNEHRILVVDYKVGNHQSVVNALDALGYNVFVSDRKEDILSADAYVLPGVGAFGEAMKNFNELGIAQTLWDQVMVKKKPILGICLGMQILADYSEENGLHKGLGWIEGGVVRLETKKSFRVPHVGWHNIEIIKKEPLFIKAVEDSTFYFDHSYHFTCENPYVAATCWYGSHVVAAVQKDNIFGVQFHPEKSQNNGLKLFRSFFYYLEKTKGVSYKHA